jgi:hypothetical protein
MTTPDLTTEEVKSLKEVQNQRDQLTINFGYVGLQLQELELQKETLVTAFLTLKQEELKIGKELQEKYGEGTIDITKGEFISKD